MMTESAAPLLTESVLIFGVNVLLHVTVVAGAALAASRCFTRRAAIRHGILLGTLILILIGPVTTAAIQYLGFGLIELPASEFSNSTNGGDLVSGLAEISGDASAVRPLSVSGASFPAGEIVGGAIGSVEEGNGLRWLNDFFPQALAVALGLAWLTGLLVCVAKLLLGWRRLAGLVQRAGAIDHPKTEATLLAAARAVGLRKSVPILESSEVDSPIAAGLCRPLVILPEHLHTRLSPEELRQVLVHELAHVIRRDPAIALLQHLAGALFWIHPLVRRLNRDLARAREEICDNHVMGSANPQSYCRVLLLLSEWIGKAGSRLPLPAAPALLTSQWRLETRVAGLLDKRRKSATRTSRGGLVILTLFFGLLLTAGAVATIRTGGGEGGTNPAETSRSDSGSTASAIEALPEGHTGIASRFPGDRGITGDPAVVFADDFESHSSTADLDRKWDVIDGTHLSLDDGALLMTIPAGAEKDPPGALLAKRLGESRKALFVRWYQKFDAGWSVPRDWFANGALISSRYFENGPSPGVPADGRNKFLVAAGNVNMFGTDPGYLGVSLYWPEQGQRWGDYFFPSGMVLPGSEDRSGRATFGGAFRARPEFTPERDRWYCQEFMVKTNTPGRWDGRVALWVDGKLVADFPNLRLRDVEELKIDRFDLTVYLPGAERVNRKWHDNVVAAISYIGPVLRPGQN